MLTDWLINLFAGVLSGWCNNYRRTGERKQLLWAAGSDLPSFPIHQSYSCFFSGSSTRLENKYVQQACPIRLAISLQVNPEPHRWNGRSGRLSSRPFRCQDEVSQWRKSFLQWECSKYTALPKSSPSGCAQPMSTGSPRPPTSGHLSCRCLTGHCGGWRGTDRRSLFIPSWSLLLPIVTHPSCPRGQLKLTDKTRSEEYRGRCFRRTSEAAALMGVRRPGGRGGEEAAQQPQPRVLRRPQGAYFSNP